MLEHTKPLSQGYSGPQGFAMQEPCSHCWFGPHATLDPQIVGGMHWSSTQIRPSSHQVSPHSGPRVHIDWQRPNPPLEPGVSLQHSKTVPHSPTFPKKQLSPSHAFRHLPLQHFKSDPAPQVLLHAEPSHCPTVQTPPQQLSDPHSLVHVSPGQRSRHLFSPFTLQQLRLDDIPQGATWSVGEQELPGHTPR